MASPAALTALLEALKTEQKKRARQFGRDGDACEQLLAKLDEMAERARAAPCWREPTAEERRENLAYLEPWFREHGYPQVASACAELGKKAALTVP